MLLIFSNLVSANSLSLNHRMYNLYAKFVKILRICKQFTQNLVNKSRYVDPLIEGGFLEMSIPEKPNSRNQKYLRSLSQSLILVTYLSRLEVTKSPCWYLQLPNSILSVVKSSICEQQFAICKMACKMKRERVI